MTFLGLMFWASLTLGAQDYKEFQPEYELEHPPIYAELTFHAENDWLSIWGEYVNEMEHIEGISFNPRQDYFTVGAEIGDQIVLGVEHMCQHPVSNSLSGHMLSGEYGGYDKIYIKFSTKR